MAGFWMAIGFAAGLAAGCVLCVVLMRYGMALHERIELGVRENAPVFGAGTGEPLEFGATGDSPEDVETDDLE